MNQQQVAATPSKARDFHTKFFLALLACLIVIFVSILSSPLIAAAGASAVHHGIAFQTLGVMCFTGLTWIILGAPNGVKEAGPIKSKLLSAIEQRMLIEQPVLANVLIWLTGLSFFVLMIEDETEAAIFLMALIAIYVAVEHLGGLHAHRVLLFEQRAQNAGFNKIQLQHIGQYKELLASLANASGLEYGKVALYQAYAESGEDPIIAVVKTFDIDLEWFLAQGTIEDYLGQQNRGAFHHAMEKASQALFVADLPLPVWRPNSSPLSSDVQLALAEQFYNLLGMAWQYCILKHIARHTPHDFQIMVARTSNWIHVAGKHVYQLMPGWVARDTNVRELTYNLTGDQAKRDLRDSMVDWASKQIKLSADGGCSGEEFLCATLFSHADFKAFAETEWMTRERLEPILRDLGMKEWIARKAEFIEGLDIDDDVLASRCLDTFEQFLRGLTIDQDAAMSLSSHLEAAVQNRRGINTICPLLYIAREVT